MTYEETVDYLFNQLANYHRQGPGAYKPGLKNIEAFCERLDHPERGFKSIHVAGTNGKGSVSHILASVYQEAGYKVGLFTSPHLLDFRERIKINGEYISKTEVVAFVNEHKDFALEYGITFFEWTTALAFHYFNLQAVDLAIIETGLGGRLDSTNVLQPMASIITNVGLDHSEFLGNTIEEIAHEKAGIIKKNSLTIIGEGNEHLWSIFKDKADSTGSILYESDSSGDFTQYSDLTGHYQQANLNTVHCLLQIAFNRQPGCELLPHSVTYQQMITGFANVKKNTGLLGRWQLIRSAPKVVCDIAHNAPALKAVMQQLREYKAGKVSVVIGLMADKAIDSIIQTLPDSIRYYPVEVNHARAMKASVLKEKLELAGRSCSNPGSVEEGYSNAINHADESDLILVCGSAYVVAEVL